MVRPYAAEDETQKKIKMISDTLMQFQWHITTKVKSTFQNIVYILDGKTSIFVVTEELLLKASGSHIKLHLTEGLRMLWTVLAVV